MPTVGAFVLTASRLAEPLLIDLGVTYRQPFLMLQGLYETKRVTEIKRGMPTLVTVPAHGLNDGWPAWLEATGGCSGLSHPRTAQPFYADVVDQDTLRFANANTTGQQAPQLALLIYSPPEDLSGVVSAEFEIYSTPDRELIDSFRSTNDEVEVEPAGIVRLHLSAERTAALAWSRGRFRLLLTLDNGDVVPRLLGDFHVRKEL